VLMFSGGFFTNVPDVWALTLGAVPEWSELHPAGDTPPARMQAGFAFDPVHDRMVVAYGALTDRSGPADDVWVLQLGDVPAWTRFQPQPRPADRNSPCMVYDPARDRFVFCGGGICDTWCLSLSPSAAWTLIEPDTQGPVVGGYLGTAIYDSTRHRVLQFGGANRYFIYDEEEAYGTDDLWSFDTGGYARWQSVAHGDGTLRPTIGATLLLDAAGNRVYRVGGLDLESGEYDHLWQCDLDAGTGWRRFYAQGDLPPDRYAASTVLDPQRRQVVMFGGRADEKALGDTWTLDLTGRPHWTQADSNADAPARRFGASAIYDPISERIVLFGGIGGADDEADYQTFGDTWELALSGSPRWARIAAAG